MNGNDIQVLGGRGGATGEFRSPSVTRRAASAATSCSPLAGKRRGRSSPPAAGRVHRGGARPRRREYAGVTAVMPL
jgi:hypothetical protein